MFRSTTSVRHLRLSVAIAVSIVTFAFNWRIVMDAHAAESIDTGVVFSAEQTEQSAKAQPMLAIGAPPYWTPSKVEIQQLESALPAFLKQSDGAAKIARNLRSYRRQYFGYSDHGEKWVLVNSFCEEYWKKDASWRNSVVFVFDGGDCYFRVRYRVSTSNFSGLEINGES
jgi:hypothetical protein